MSRFFTQVSCNQRQWPFKIAGLGLTVSIAILTNERAFIGLVASFYLSREVAALSTNSVDSEFYLRILLTWSGVLLTGLVSTDSLSAIVKSPLASVWFTIGAWIVCAVAISLLELTELALVCCYAYMRKQSKQNSE